MAAQQPCILLMPLRVGVNCLIPVDKKSYDEHRAHHVLGRTIICIVMLWHCTGQPNGHVIKWKLFPRYRPFVRGIHRSPVNSPQEGQWHRVLMFSLVCAGINGWVNNGEAGDLRRHRAHYDVIVKSNLKRPDTFRLRHKRALFLQMPLSHLSVVSSTSIKLTKTRVLKNVNLKSNKSCSSHEMYCNRRSRCQLGTHESDMPVLVDM